MKKTLTATLGLVLAGSLGAQTRAEQKTADKAAAYYNFSMGHLYSELAQAYGARGEYLTKAIDHYKQAMKLDPEAGFLVEDIVELYIQANQVRSAINEAEELLKTDPNNLTARRMLGRIHTRMIGDGQGGKINEDAVKKAIEQFEFVIKKDAKDTESWVTLGRLYRVTQNSVEARKAFETAIELDPTDEDALTGLAMVYSDLGDIKNMTEMLRRAAEKSPSLRSLTALASAYEQMRDFNGAAEVLKKALASGGENPQILRALAQNLLFADRADEALDIYQKVLAEEPKDAQTHLRIAEIYRGKHNLAKARAALDKAIEIDKNSLEVRYEEVAMFEAEGRDEEAITVLRKILDDTQRLTYAQPERANRAMFLDRLASLQRSTKQYAKAIETFREIEKLVTETGPRVAVQIVETHRAAKEHAKAFEMARAAHERFPTERPVVVTWASLLADSGEAAKGVAQVQTLLTPGDPPAKDRELYLTIAQLWEKGKNYAEMEKAVAMAEKLSDSKADTEGILFMRGAMLEKQKKFEAAEAAFRKLIETNPDSPSALNYLGYMLADRNVRLDEARTMIEKALALDPNNGAYLDSLGWVLYRQGHYDDAEKYLRRSIERVSGDATVYDHLGDVLVKQGKIKDAIAQWQLSLREWETASKADADPVEIAKVTKKLEGARVRLAREGKAEKQP